MSPSTTSLSLFARPLSPTRFFVVFAIGLLPALAFAVLSALFLWRSHESASLDDVAAAQQRTGGIYASAITDDFYRYKLALYRATRPRIVAIGSSRAMEFQSLGFRDSFLSLGGAVHSLPEVERLIADMEATGPLPSLVLLELDYWWFNADYRVDDAPSAQPLLGIMFQREKDELERSLGRYFVPAAWLRTRKVTAREMVEVGVLGKQLSPPLPPGYGLFALSRLQGFASDGHYRYFGTAFGRMPATDRHFDESRSQVQSGKTRYVFGVHPLDSRFADLREIVARLEATGSRVITVVPPIAAGFRDELTRQGTRLGYIDETLARLRSERPRHYDFHDASALGSNDCEFVDAYHGGEVTYLRMVLAIAQDPASGLGPHVDLDLLRAAIARSAGKVLADGESYAPMYREVDFLDLGCSK